MIVFMTFHKSCPLKTKQPLSTIAKLSSKIMIRTLVSNWRKKCVFECVVYHIFNWIYPPPFRESYLAEQLHGIAHFLAPDSNKSYLTLCGPMFQNNKVLLWVFLGAGHPSIPLRHKWRGTKQILVPELKNQ